ncbi:MAG: hypothetical protein ACJ72Z_00765, partial [Pyrinomonadaceae bacterium]
MFVAIFLIIAVSMGGFALTYILESEEPLLWRFAAGSVIGQCVFGTVLFLFTFVLGLNYAAIITAAAVACAPLLLLRKQGYRRAFDNDWSKAKGKVQGSNPKKLLPFIYYFGFFLFFIFFFDRVMMITDEGVFTGGSNNLGDLPFHLGIIYSFIDGSNFPPQNPSFAGAKLTYPFIADLATAAQMKMGAGIREAMLAQNVSWAFALLVILERFVFGLVNDKFAARLAPFLLFFSGGLGFLWFFSDYAAQTKSLFQLLFDIGKDYTITNEFRWGNSLITLFLTQRSLLLGMPLTLIILGGLWKMFSAENKRIEDNSNLLRILVSSPFILGLLAGTLPLIHLHSLFVLFVVTAGLFVMQAAGWREWVAFGTGVCIIAIPELAWSISGSATQASEFFEWHFGWDSGTTNFIWFWLKNTGVFIPMLAVGIFYFISLRDPDPVPERSIKKKAKRDSHEFEKPTSTAHAKLLLLFYIPFLFLFVLSNIAKLAPWEWDNIKVLIYWYIGSIPFVAVVIAWLWRRKQILRLAAALLIFILTASGGLDVWRTVSRQHNYRIFDSDAVAIAQRLR